MKNNIRRFFVVLLLVLSAVFFYKAYQEHRPFEDAKVKQQAVKEAVIQDDDSDDPLDRYIDFQTLRKINPDIIGWLYIPQIGVDHPVLKGQNDWEYLNQDFERQYSPLGSIFTYSHTNEKLMDSHICLFGHNMPSGQMFGNLQKFENQDFLEKNNVFYLYTPEHAKALKIESVQECYMTDDIFQDDWNGSNRQTVVLSSCAGYDATPIRFTVLGSVIKEKLIL